MKRPTTQKLNEYLTVRDQTLSYGWLMRQYLEGKRALSLHERFEMKDREFYKDEVKDVTNACIEQIETDIAIVKIQLGTPMFMR